MFGRKIAHQPNIFDGGASIIADAFAAATSKLSAWSPDEPGRGGFQIVPVAQGFELQREEAQVLSIATSFIPLIHIYWGWSVIGLFPTWEAAENGIARVLHGKARKYTADGRGVV